MGKFITTGTFLTDAFWFSNMPEFELEGLWYLDVLDGNENTISWGSYFLPNQRVDYYISSVNIPQLNLNYETTDIGMVYFKEKSAYEDVTINFYDDLHGSFKSFINDWLHCIYDEKTQSVKAKWRYEAKDLVVTNYRMIWGKIQKTATYGLLRCLPKGISEITMDDDGGDRKGYSLQLICQKVETNADKINPLFKKDLVY